MIGDLFVGIFFFFFFKQKTAYEISECDWSPDVCSSALTQDPFSRSTSFLRSLCGSRYDLLTTLEGPLQLASASFRKTYSPQFALYSRKSLLEILWKKQIPAVLR